MLRLLKIAPTGHEDPRAGGPADPDEEWVAAASPPAAGAEEEEAAASPNRRVPAVRFPQLARPLGRLGCEVRRAKGSEVSVYRAGHGRYVFGLHTPNR